MQPLSISFMALLLAHLLGDFPLQPAWIAKQKGRRLWPLICHGLIHYALALSCLWIFTQVPCFSIYTQVIVVAYLALHLLIDWLKCRLTARRVLRDSGLVFLIDQAVHVLFLGLAAMFLSRSGLSGLVSIVRLSPAARTHVLETAIIYVAVIFGGGYLIRYLTRGFATAGTAESPAQLENAGLYLGWIERFLVITAIAMQSPVLVGLILTGKSLARFPEFKEPRFAEYFLIGTLLSISLSLLGGIILLQLLYGTVSLK
jgi:hypothetical protein